MRKRVIAEVEITEIGKAREEGFLESLQAVIVEIEIVEKPDEISKSSGQLDEVVMAQVQSSEMDQRAEFLGESGQAIVCQDERLQRPEPSDFRWDGGDFILISVQRLQLEASEKI